MKIHPHIPLTSCHLQDEVRIEQPLLPEPLSCTDEHVGQEHHASLNDQCLCDVTVWKIEEGAQHDSNAAHHASDNYPIRFLGKNHVMLICQTNF